MDSSNPSFSSTLLDAIYKSIDEGDEQKLVFYRETMRKKPKGFASNLKDSVCFKDEAEMEEFQRVCMIEKWMEKKESQKGVVRRRSLADFVPKVKDNPEIFFSNSSLSSSDSTSEVESVHGVSSSSSSSSSSTSSSSSRSSCYFLQRPKPIRTSLKAQEEKPNQLGKQFNMHPDDYGLQQKPKHETKSVKSTKSRALKIYGDLKKAKQPISPGGKLASFLNSLFTSGNTKKANKSSSERKSKSANASTCSSASSFSRSCLSKTPSSRGKLPSNGMKRSVRFYPVSVIVDEDCQPCGHKNLHEEKPSMEGVKDMRNTSINEKLKFHMEKNARDLLRNYHLRTTHVDDDDEDDDVDDDDASYASSDLFELDNLSAIGMDHQRYREELPVYETTHLDTNRAIANRMIL